MGGWKYLLQTLFSIRRFTLMHKDVLRKIRNFADQAHGDQTRKYSDEKYIVHPERVMKICSEYSNKVPVLAAALLHDVLEDTETSKEDIFKFITGLMGYSSAQATIRLVEEVTDIYEKKSYPHWNRAKRKSMEADRLAKVSAEAQLIKYADIVDNTREIMEADPDFGRRFLRECKDLLQKMTKGNEKLRYRAISAVEENLKR